MSEWEQVSCHFCGSSRSEVLFPVLHADAPQGSANVLRCLNDGLIYTSPRPRANEIERYYSRSCNAYVGRKRGKMKQLLWNSCRDLGLDVFDISVKADRGKHILDVGCGYGDLLLYYKSRSMVCTGVDFSATAVARGKEYGLNILHGSLQSQQFKDASFDKVVLCHSLEHMPDPKQVIAEVHRLLKPGGTLQVAVPNGGSDAFGPNWGHLSFPLHLHHFTESTLRSCISGAGFRKVSVNIRKRTDALRATAEA